MMITANNLCISYDGKKNVIENCNLHIKKKDFVVLMGKSGSGKSTLLKSLYSGIKVNKGILVVNNKDISRISNSELCNFRKKIGIVFQDYRLIKEQTIKDNIMLPLFINGYTKSVASRQANSLLDHIELSHKANAYPNELSGGEQQRVAVARALSHNPEIILADEPTGNLDEFSAGVIWNLLVSANRQLDITIFVVTHNVPANIGIKYRHLSVDDGVVYEIS